VFTWNVFLDTGKPLARKTLPSVVKKKVPEMNMEGGRYERALCWAWKGKIGAPGHVIGRWLKLTILVFFLSDPT